MSRKADRIAELQFAFEQFQKSGHADWLAGIIRMGGAIDVPWPVGMAEALADLVDRGDPWTSRDQAQADDSWINFVYWRETEFRTGIQSNTISMAGIRAVEDWFEARGTPKGYETIRTRLREKYDYWRSKLTDEELAAMHDAARGGEKI